MLAQSEKTDFLFDPQRHKFLDDRRGGLKIWAPPVAGKLYLAGIDSCGGLHGGDYAALCMVETETRALVAQWHGRYDPTEWGRMCARLGAYYNKAMLAFETHPSQHGLSSCLAARAIGYTNLFVRVQIGTVSRRRYEQLGWATTSASKGVLWNKLRVAINERHEIPSEELLMQLLQGRMKEGSTGEIVFEDHDDLAIAYGIALCACDIVAVQGYVTPSMREPRTFQEAWWHARKQELNGAPAKEAEIETFNDGV